MPKIQNPKNKSQSPPEATLQEILDTFSQFTKAKSQAQEQAFLCPICLLVRRSVERSLRSFFAEYVNDPRVRDELRKAHGFCNVHTPLLETLGDALAIAIIYNDLTQFAIERWENSTSNSKKFGVFRGKNRVFAAPEALCPACISEKEATKHYVGAFVDGFFRQEVREALENSDGFCVSHSEEVLTFAKPEDAEYFQQIEMQKLASLQKELEEIIRKNDYRFRGEEWGTEKDAWQRALKKCTRK